MGLCDCYMSSHWLQKGFGTTWGRATLPVWGEADLWLGGELWCFGDAEVPCRKCGRKKMAARGKHQLVWEGGLTGAVQSQNLTSREISWVSIICSLSRPVFFKLYSLLLPRLCAYYIQMSFFNPAFKVICCCSVMSDCATPWTAAHQASLPFTLF